MNNLNQTFLYQILIALKYIQNKCYMHRDLKPQNIMVTKNHQIKIIDFGQAKRLNISSFEKSQQTL